MELEQTVTNKIFKEEVIDSTNKEILIAALEDKEIFY